MAQFWITQRWPDGQEKKFCYDNSLSTLKNEQGEVISVQPFGYLAATKERQRVLGHNQPPPFLAVSADTPGIKLKGQISRIRISLGMACNFSCSYCLQKYEPRDSGVTEAQVHDFVEKMPSWAGTEKENLWIQFIGGEPFVYWKTLKPLGELIRKKYPKADLYICTNGSLLDEEKNQWLIDLRVTVSISHDGPGQSVRGQDPLRESPSKEYIQDLYQKLHPLGRISFNTMMNAHNMSRVQVVEYFQEIFGSDVVVGEGGLIDSYDEAGTQLSLTPELAIQYRRQAYMEAQSGKVKNVQLIGQKVSEFINTLASGRSAEKLGQKCGMDRPDYIAVDLKGNVLTCQNLTAKSVNSKGQSHKIGHVDDLDKVRLNTVTHWSYRKNCSNCPVLQLCKGSCMYIDGKEFEASCENSYADNVVFLALAMSILVGGTTVHIEGPHPEHRKDIFGLGAVVDQSIPDNLKKEELPSCPSFEAQGGVSTF